MSVLSGLDVLEKGDFKHLKGRRVGVLCHHASVDRNFRHIAPLLKSNCELRSAFSPEHGLWGAKDGRIGGTNIDSRIGIPVHSLYGETYRPTMEMLEGLDTLVIDLQDVGARFYTYTWTMAHCLAACEQHGLRAVVLDRPNPIGGALAEGPVLESSLSSFVGLHPVAQRHGMTHGELATWMKGRFYPGLHLRVVRMEGWKRPMYFERTGLPWIVPSPAMPRVDTAVVYPGTCLFEGTDLSEGRGTTRPFETFGHPAIDGWKLAERLNAAKPKGVYFRPLFFQPTSSKHVGKGCGGCFAHVLDRSAFRPVATAIAILHSIHDRWPAALGWEDEARGARFDRLAGCRWLRESISAGESLHAIHERIESASTTFMGERKEALLY